jgi:hypothetical protein
MIQAIAIPVNDVDSNAVYVQAEYTVIPSAPPLEEIYTSNENKLYTSQLCNAVKYAKSLDDDSDSRSGYKLVPNAVPLRNILLYDITKLSNDQLFDTFCDAVFTNNIEIVKYLLGTGCINLKKMNRHPQHEASILGYACEDTNISIDMIKLLIATGQSEPDYYDPETKTTPLVDTLIHRKSTERIEILKLLFSTGKVLPYLVDYDNKIPSDYAKEFECHEYFDILHAYLKKYNC